MDKLHGDSKVKITKIGQNGTETVEVEGNTFLDEGIKHIWTLVCGGITSSLTATNTYVGVGDGSVPAVSTQLSLQGASTAFNPISDEYPIYGDATHVTVRAQFGHDEATFDWNEMVVETDGVNINRLVKDMGTKPDDETWVVDVNLILE